MTSNRDDLVVLVYSKNPCYTDLTTANDPLVTKAGVTIDHDKGTWTYTGPGESSRQVVQKHQIGKGYPRPVGSRWGVIGVYDRTKQEHLKSMLSDSAEAVKDQGSVLED